MPKIKDIGTRQTSEEVVVMSWSPKMDLLALGNIKGYVHLHRLAWQKVWQVALISRESPAIPEHMTWHPEGLFLLVTAGKTTFVIDVEGGKIVHNHELPFHITAARWCLSQYHHAVNDVIKVLSSSTRQSQTDLKIQRLESNLSILFLGTSNGFVYAYTGGFLLGLCIRVADENSTPYILQVDATRSLESFFFLSDDDAGQSDDMTITFSHFRNDYLPQMAPIIGPLGLKYILFLKSWALIQAELGTLNDVWSRMVELYLMYMTFGGTRDMKAVKIDFLELLFTGICTVEMEMFLGSVGREKEAKKNANLIASANASLTVNVRTIKCSITNLLTDLNEIGGFLENISGYEEASQVIIELRKSASYLFLAVLHIQSLIYNFVEVSLHFMHLILNTIHSFNNTQEVPDFIEEDADPDRVLEFLEAKIEKDIFEYLFANVQVGHNLNKEDKDKVNLDDEPTTSGSGFNLENGVNKYKDFSNFVRSLLNQGLSNLPIASTGGHPILLDCSESEVEDLVNDIIPRITKLTKSLLNIPVLCSVPFDAENYPIIRIPKSEYFVPPLVNENDEHLIPLRIRKPKPFQLFLDPESPKAYLSAQLTSKRVLLFQTDVTNPKKMLLKSSMLHFSRNVICSEIFSANHITIVSYDGKDKRNEQQDMGRTILCQIPYTSLTSRSPYIDIKRLTSKCGGKSVLPMIVNIDVPLDICKPSPSCNTCIDYLLPIQDFAPSSLTVSGLRRVGALLGENKRTILLLEMESEFTESTVDDGGEDDASDSGAVD